MTFPALGVALYGAPALAYGMIAWACWCRTWSSRCACMSGTGHA
jgi:hypothetical protein